MRFASLVAMVGLCVAVPCSCKSGKTDEASKSRPAGAVAGERRSLDLGGGVTMKLVVVPAGEFMMGNPRAGGSDEGPCHKVTIGRAFCLGACEVTQEQYEAVMGANPSRFKGPANPVDSVSWHQAVEFCRKVSAKTGQPVRLPTEAQWEYACRAGSPAAYTFGDDAAGLGAHAWFDGTSGKTTHPVAQKAPNAWGLYDMHGNVWEWCSDWYQRSYRDLPPADPSGPASGTFRIIRGGGWGAVAQACGSSFRFRYAPDRPGDFIGFRVAMELK